MIYLDNAATTLKKPPCVAEAVVRAMATMGNSGRSAHQEALDASRVIYRTREQLARLLGCSAAERVVFTCNSTEALNIAIDGLFAPGDHVLSTDCEHNSVLRPLYRLEGVEVDFLPADRQGCIDYDDFRRLLRPNTRGIVCTHGSNLTGNLLDIRTIGRFAKEHGLLLGCSTLTWRPWASTWCASPVTRACWGRRAPADCASLRGWTSAPSR